MLLVEKNYIKYQGYLMAIYDKKNYRNRFFICCHKNNSDFARFNVTFVLLNFADYGHTMITHSCTCFLSMLVVENFLRTFVQQEDLTMGLDCSLEQK